MRLVGVALVLGGERGGHRAAAGAAGKHHLLALRVGNGGGIERRQRHDHRVRIAFDRGLVRLAHVDQQHAPGAQAFGHLFRREIFNFVGARDFVGHAQLPSAF